MLWSLIAAAVVLLVPGGALLAWVSFDSPARPSAAPGVPRSLVSLLIDSAGISIAIYSLVAMFGFFIGIRFPPAVLFVFYGLCLAALIWAALRRRASLPDARRLLRWLVAGLFTTALIAALVGWRLYQARDLALPAWVDSVHHTLIVRLILEQGGLPADLTPYIEARFFYHYGFHLTAALFSFLSGVSPDQSVLWFGQAINGLVALSVFRVAEALRDPVCEHVSASSDAETETEPDRWAQWRGRFSFALPIAAALLVGFSFQMPAYYLTWGRFTLLTGLLLTGPALAAALDAWQNADRFDAWLRLALLVTGLALTHYFALLLLALFLLFMGAAALYQFARRRERWNFLWRMAAFSLVGLALAAPWIWHVLQYSPVGADVQVASPVASTEEAQQRAADYLRYLGYLIGPRRNYILLAAAAAGLLFALRYPRWRFLAGWGVLLGLLSLPWGLRIQPFRPDHYAIVLFFPAALLLALMLVDGAAAVSAATRPWLGALALVGLASVFVFWGMRDTRDILNPTTIIAGKADVRALAWVRDHTPKDARFYINSTPWQGSTYRGVDGGYWLAPYAGRVSMVPPAFYAWGARDYVAQISDWISRSAALQGCTAEFWDLARDARLTHVYLQEGRGSLQPAALAGCQGLRLVYQDDGVYIYEILPPG